MDSYKTIERQACEEFTEKRSRFIAEVKPIESEKEAIEFINAKKEKFWDARHNVYAYILRENNIMRYSDDGEPQGTAGMPSLDVLKKNEVCNVVVVVTRYFGGILLGTGGLVRAYSHSVKLALDSARIITMKKCSILSFECEYSEYGKIKALISSGNAKILDENFLSRVSVRCCVVLDEKQKLIKELSEITSGQINVVDDGEEYFQL